MSGRATGGEAGTRARARRLVAVLSLLIWAHGAQLFADQRQPPAALASPPPGGGRIFVEVGLYFVNLLVLDEVTQEFSFVAYLFVKWNDPRLRLASGDPAGLRGYDLKTQWAPTLEVNNAAAPRQVSAREAAVDPDGTVRYVEKFTATAQADLHFRRFPFDHQALDVFIRPFVSQASLVRLKVNQARSGISTAPYAPLAMWELERVTQAQLVGVDGIDALRFRAVVRRDFQYYVWRIFLPLFLLVCMSWSVLWMPPGDLSNQVLISVSTIFTLVVFSSAISSVVPAVPYLTFYDVFFLICYVFVLLTAAEVLAVHSRQRRGGHDRAAQMRHALRWIMPSCFIGLIAATAAMFALMS